MVESMLILMGGLTSFKRRDTLCNGGSLQEMAAAAASTS